MDKKKIFDTIINATKIVAPAVVTEQVYDKMFNHHFTTYKPLSFSLTDYPDLVAERHTFKSGNKSQLVGYIYRCKSLQNKGIFVFSHGFGTGGHHNYLDLIHAICKNGFYVFAYDATACDESEGHTLKGFTTGMLDADKAISYVESLKEYQKINLYLCGHSWGAYSASTALGWHKRVKGLIAFSGFNQATEIFRANGEKYAGDQSKDFMSYVDAWEKLLFGDICKRTAVKSFKESKARIAIVHSYDDKTVPITAGFNIYKKEFAKDKRFKFVKFLSRGHGTVYYSVENRHYYEKFHNEFNKYVKHNKPTEEDKIKYINEHLNRKKYSNLVDEKLIKDLIKFITK